jgi:hypothetical protein
VSIAGINSERYRVKNTSETPDEKATDTMTASRKNLNFGILLQRINVSVRGHTVPGAANTTTDKKRRE